VGETENAADLEVMELGRRAKAAARALALASTAQKDDALTAAAAALAAGAEGILAANAEDVADAKDRGVRDSLIDRLRLDAKRVAEMADALREMAGLADPVGVLRSGSRRPNGLELREVTVPLGVVGMIYESRPNVTVDAAGLCLKSGNAVILRGGRDAIASNTALVEVLRPAIAGAGLPADAVQLIANTERASATALMRCNRYVDVLIPRGGAGLIQTVVQSSTVPVIETGVGNCHTFIDASADLEMALAITINAKCQRPGVCNAMETLLVHEEIAERFLPRAIEALTDRGCEIRGCDRTRRIGGGKVKPAGEEDWATEFLDLTLAVRVVDSLAEALDHIAEYGSLHSEAIVTADLDNAQHFTRAVDAAAVYVNASTRFTDGGQFGMAGEIGISTQKLHARGPVGLEKLVSTKFVVFGSGQVRG
jgi:glutamate-5-semialdehyde dehydrogenase